VTALNRTLLSSAILFLTSFASPSLGQGTRPANLSFAYQGPTDATPRAIANTGAMIFPPTSLGLQATLQFFITNMDNQASAIISGITIAGASDFAVSTNVLRVPPLNVSSFILTFSPSTTAIVNATLNFQAQDGSTFRFTLSGQGVSPQYVLAYSLTADGNQLRIQDGALLTFPVTPVSQTSTITIFISNQGTGNGSVSQVALSGSTSFKFTGLPLLPAQIAPKSTFQFNVVYAPAQAGADQGVLRIVTDTSTYNLSLTGNSSASSLAYQVISGSAATSLPPGGSITFPQTLVAGTASVTVQVLNVGNAPGVVNSVNVGTGPFSITGLPGLPITLAPGASTTFLLNFTPTAPGLVSGRLLIDQASFTLSGTGLGPLVSFSFVVGGSTSPITNNGTASFPNTAVGLITSGTINIQNTGNQPASINGVSLQSSVFAAVIPATPITISPGATVSVTVNFGPLSIGLATAVLGFDNIVINLRGFGTAPPPLPAYSFAGAGDTVAPLSQPSISLTLAAPYASDITGTLTLTFTSGSFADDPAIQFANGGRTVSFKIPANTTAAIFGAGATTVQFQTGTVAGVITLIPAFSTSQVSLTPASPTTKTLTIVGSPPTILNLQIGTRTANSFELLITGWSTIRSVTQINLQFTPASAGKLQTTSLSINVEGAFAAWYQSAASIASGSQFTASVTILATGSLSALQSVAVTAANSLGSSNSATVSLQ
jgi:hypothetical protein